MINVGLSRIPDSAALHAARGVSYVQSGQPEKGEADFAAAAKLNPNQAFGSEAYGLASFQVKDLDTALICVRAKLKAHPNDAFLEYLLAQILARQGPGRQRGVQPGSSSRDAGDCFEPQPYRSPRRARKPVP